MVEHKPAITIRLPQAHAAELSIETDAGTQVIWLKYSDVRKLAISAAEVLSRMRPSNS
jgi:hypothetical protein